MFGKSHELVQLDHGIMIVNSGQRFQFAASIWQQTSAISLKYLMA